MIHLKDATTLALTKLRTRKVRLTVTIVISGLLFSILAGASIVSRGVFSSLDDFSDDAFAKRFIVSATPATNGSYYNETVIARAEVLQKDLVARKKTEAKRLGLDYSADSEMRAVEEYDTPIGKMKSLNPVAPAAQQAIAEYNKDHPLPSQAALKQAAASYGGKDYYETLHVPYDLGGARMKVLVDGKESFDNDGDPRRSYGMPTGTDSFPTSWTLMSKSLLQPFVLPGQSLEQGKDGSMPVIVPLSAAEQLVGMKSLPATATSKEQLARTKLIRQKAARVTFEVCYRNMTSASLVEDAINVQKELERNKNKKDYVKPDYILNLPSEACGVPSVARDARSKEQKTRDAKETEFRQLFGEKAAEQATMKFRIVGIVPDPSQGASMTVSEIARGLVASSLGNGWFTPLEVRTEQPVVDKIFSSGTGGDMFPQYSVEFATAASAKEFIKEENCEPDYRSAKSPSDDPYKDCIAANHHFVLGSYGSNSLALDSARKGFNKIFRIAGLVIAIIACLIMMGTVGKMIADSRRETAVFRAIGAKKLDIAQIYVLYTIFLSVLITAFAVLLGMVAAMIAQAKFGDEVTVQAILAYNTPDLTKSFHLYHFHLPDMLFLLAVTVGAGVLSSLIPLFRNLRRNPMRDMRDDT